ncbi:hypothetical protein MBANPS3_012157 [Mucor bainieri]
MQRKDTLWRTLDQDAINSIHCQEWGLCPIFQVIRCNKQVAVCRQHVRGVFVGLEYPGPPIQGLNQRFHYRRERSCLSNIKIMSPVTKKTNAQQSYCGHYELTGSVWTE